MDLRLLQAIFTILLVSTTVSFTRTDGANIEKVESNKQLTLSGFRSFDVYIGQSVIIQYLSTLTIICEINAESEERTTIYWQFNGVNIQFNNSEANNFPNIRLKSAEELTIFDITDQQAGEYTCILENANSEEELDRGVSTLEVLSECSKNCQGKKGEKGFTGKRGGPGLDGVEGVVGYCDPASCNGSRGVVGKKGEPGANEEVGINGTRGEKGRKGGMGDNGIRGDAGNNGEKGDMGEKGTKGELGDQGEKGEKGLKGAEGDEGIRGGNGLGMKGEKGEQGNTTSPSGEVGDQGPKGVRGEQGTTETKGENGTKGERGINEIKGIKGSKGVTGTEGEKGMVGKNLLILAINSTYNSNCQNYEKGQIIYDTAIGKFVFCDGDQFQCIPDKPCREDCKDGDPTINTINPNIPAQCVNLIYVIDESASMRPEQQWLRYVANAIPRELRRINYNPGVCMNNFGVLGFGTGEEASRAEQIGRPIDLGGITQDRTFVPLWGSTSEVIRVINEGIFAGEGRREDGFAALYRALQRYTFVGVGCRKMLLITDEDRDNETPSPDPPYDRVPTLFNLNMQQILNQFSITLSAVISIQFQAQNDQQPNINYNTTLGLLPNNSVIYYDENSQRNYSVASDGYVRRDSAAGNTEQTYFQQVRASGGIAWSLQASRTYRDAFTSAFLQFEIIPHVPQNNSTQASGGCMLDSCNACPCVDGERYCQPINNLDFNTTIKCRPTECNQTQIISGFRQPACIDMVFAFSETQTMLAEHDSIKDVAINLAINLAKINFGQENSLCPNTYCLVGFGSENNRNSDQCYTESFRIPPNNQLCATSAQLANLIEGLALTATGNESDGYAAIYTALQTYQATFQSQSCRHITLVTDTNRLDCGSYTDGSVSIPQLSKTNIASVMRDTNVVLNVIVNATFQDGSGNEALGIYQETNGSIVAVIPDSTAQFGFSTSPGGSVRLAGDQVEEDYIDLAIIVGGSAWDIRKMGEQTDLFTKAFVQAVVIKSSESCGQTRACVECKCVGGEIQRCEESTVCKAAPKWDKTLLGNVKGSEASLGQTLFGSFGSELRITGTVREGTEPWRVRWYYNGMEIVEGQDYSFEISGNQATIVINSLKSSGIGTYTVNVSNNFGEDTHTFNVIECKSCSIAGEELGCCESDTFLYNKEEEGVDVMLVLDATEDMASANSFIFETLLPDLEAKLLENSVGINESSRNQYIITVLDQNDDEAFPSTLLMGFFSFSAQNMTNLTRAYDEFNSMGFKNDGRGAYGAVKSVLGRSARPTLNRILIVNTNKRRNVTIYNRAVWRRLSYYHSDDNGRSIFSNELSHEKIQPILIVNASLVNNETSLSCLGVSDLLECFHNKSGKIEIVHGNLTTNIPEGNLDLNDIHQDFVIPGLTGGGHVWDIKAIIEGTSHARGNISESIVRSVVPRVKGKCNDCNCFNGKEVCTPRKGNNEEQRYCQCELIHGADVCKCQGLGADTNCQVSPKRCLCNDPNIDCCRVF